MRVEQHDSCSHSFEKLFSHVAVDKTARHKTTTRICIVHFVAERVVAGRLVAVAMDEH